MVHLARTKKVLLRRIAPFAWRISLGLGLLKGYWNIGFAKGAASAAVIFFAGFCDVDFDGCIAGWLAGAGAFCLGSSLREDSFRTASLRAGGIRIVSFRTGRIAAGF